MNKISIITLIFLLNFSISYAQRLTLTPYEKSQKTETATYEEIIQFSEFLDKSSEYIKYTIIGKTGNGYDIPMLIYDPSKSFSVENAKNTNKSILLIQAGIHAGEPEGTDAGLMLFRDLSVSREVKYPNTIILFIPTINPEGCLRRSAYNRINQNGPKEMGWRTNASNLNLNRDYVKVESPEIKAFINVFNQWLPDFFIDCHSTDGADYQYVMTYDLTNVGMLSDAQNKWLDNIFMPELQNIMLKKNYPMFRYVTFKNWHDPRSGLIRWVASPVLSEGYAAVRNRPGLLLETHMLKPYNQRTDATYEVLKYAANLLSSQHKKIVELNKTSDEELILFSKNNMPIAIEFSSLNDSILINFEGVEYGIDKSDLTGGDWFKYSSNPATFKIWYHDKPLPTKSVKLPSAYIFEPAWKEIRDILDVHGIKYYRLYKDMELIVEKYKLSDIVFAQSSFEGHQQLISYNLSLTIDTIVFPKESIIIPTNCVHARLLAYMFEPESSSSLLKYGYFNAMFEQKEYGESYVMEVLAREMLKNDPKLKEEFERKMKTEKEFASSQRAILNWFYQQSNYKDEKMNTYPIYRLNESQRIKTTSK